jgi:secondary thiamine-phosphate synthase enzyme
MKKFTVATHRRREVLDITEQIEAMLPPASGICCLNVLHTTAALATADLDPGTDLDMLDAFEAMMPKLKYRHPHNPEHVPDHILSSLIGTALTLPVQEGSVVLGTWQRVILVELDGPRPRELTMHFLKSS